MLQLARWSTSHRKYVPIGWIALLVLVNVLAQSAGTERRPRTIAAVSAIVMLAIAAPATAPRLGSSDNAEREDTTNSEPAGARRGGRPEVATEGADG